MKQEYERLSLWGAANRKRLTKDGATKTVELPAGAVFWRDQPAKVSIKKSRKIDDVPSRRSRSWACAASYVRSTN